MSNNQNSSYPIIFGRVGSIVKNGNIFLSDVINGDITKFKKGGEGKTFMSGRSNYVQTNEMNKGSFGVSGSYGISGISKVEASVGGYVGNAVATGAESMMVSYNAYISSGVEYLNINDLTLIDLICGLSKNPQSKMLEIIDNFSNVMNQIEGEDLNDIDVSVFEKWIKSVDEFRKNYGDSLVVAVHWGAFGSVDMVMTNSNDGHNTNYGAEGNFSYSNLLSSVSVKATYNGNNSSANSGVKVDVQSSVTGESIRTIIEQWRAKAEGKTFEQLANVKMIAEVPSLNVPAGIIPNVPEFVAPIEKPAEIDGKTIEKPVTESVKKVKNLENLKSFSLANLFSKQIKKIGPAIGSFSEFIKGVIQPADTAPLDTLIENGEAIELNDLSIFKKNKGFQLESFNAPKMASSQEEEFVPLGLLTCEWSELFPWLATGFDNGLGDLKSAKELLNWRSMIQDFITLSSTYNRVKNSFRGADIMHVKADVIDQIILSFERATNELQEKQSTMSYKESMAAAFTMLTPNAKAIYKVWMDNPVLRKGELGFGFVARNVTGSKYTYTTISEVDLKNGSSDYSKLNKWSSIDFDVAQPNPSVFASAMKSYPVILPDGKIYAFSFISAWAFTNKYSYEPVHWKTPLKELVSDASGKFLRVVDSDRLMLYPIPFSAAKGISWKGSAAGAPNLTSFADLGDSISSLKKQLSDQGKFPLSSNSFKDITWKTDIGLSDLKVKTQYVGIVPEQKDLMRLF